MKLEFWVPILTFIALAIWNLFQQIKLAQLKKENEKKLLVHKLQFEKEFNIYSSIWKELIALKNSISQLRPEIEKTLASKSFDEIKRMILGKVSGHFTELNKLIEYNQPFYAEIVYVELVKIISLSKKEILSLKFQEDIKPIDYWEDAKRNLNEIDKLSDTVCEAIRKRIGTLKIGD